MSRLKTITLIALGLSLLHVLCMSEDDNPYYQTENAAVSFTLDSQTMDSTSTSLRGRTEDGQPIRIGVIGTALQLIDSMFVTIDEDSTVRVAMDSFGDSWEDTAWVSHTFYAPGEHQVVAEGYIRDGMIRNDTLAILVEGLAASVTTQPSSIDAVAGDSVRLEVAAQGSSPLTYGWLKDGSPIDGEDSAFLSFSAIALGDAGTYRSIVTNPYGDPDTSDAAEITVVRARYTIVLARQGLGEADSLDTLTINHNRDTVVEIGAVDGYVLDSLFVDSEAVEPSGSVSFTGVQADHHVRAVFSAIQYTLILESDDNGSVEPEGSQTVDHGMPVTITANALSGYHFVGWVTEAGDADIADPNADSTTVRLLSGDVTLKATFGINDYTVTVTTGDNGTIKPDGEVAASHGENLTFEFTPDAGFSVCAVVVDGNDVDAVSSYDLANITKDHTIKVEFCADSFDLAVSSDGNGEVSPASDRMGYADSVDIVASADSGYSFVVWRTISGEPEIEDSTDDSTVVILTGDASVQAIFGKNRYPLTIIASHGTVSKDPDAASYEYGTTVQLEAIPDEGYAFSEWSGDVSGSESTKTIVMDDAMTIAASFAKMSYPLDVSVTGNGTVTRSQDGPYLHGAELTLTAVPATGYLFSSWSGDVSGTESEVNFAVDSTMSLMATFVKEEYAVDVTVGGEGTVSRSADGPYPYGTELTLTAEPATGYHFSGWSGDVAGTESMTTFSVDSTMNVTATFVKEGYAVDVTVSGEGTISRSANGPYPYGTELTLTAEPAFGYEFSGWSDDITGTESATTFSVDSGMSITATFVKKELSVAVTESGQGTVSRSADGPYPYGTELTLTAEPSTGYHFSGWSGDITGTDNTATFSVDSTMNVTATFVKEGYTVDVTVSGDGTVSRSTNEPYPYQTDLTLTAEPATGYRFTGWSGDITGSESTVTFSVDSAMEVSATFVKIDYDVKVTATGDGTVSGAESSSYPYGTVLELTAVPGTEFRFDGWSEGATGSENPLTVTVDSELNITATFVKKEYPVNVTNNGQGTISRGDQGPGPYPHGTVLTLTANAGEGYAFSEWTAEGLNTNVNPLKVTVTDTMNIVANFVPTYTIESSATNGTIAVTPFQSEYIQGSPVKLEAKPDEGYAFSGWTGDVPAGSANPVTITMDSDKSVEASFHKVYSVSVANPQWGTITYSPDTSDMFAAGTEITFTVTPDPEFEFESWAEPYSAFLGEPLKVTLSEDITDLNANFSVTSDSYLEVFFPFYAGKIDYETPSSPALITDTTVTASPTADRFGTADRAAHFADANEWVSVDFAEDVLPSGSFTIAFWMKPETSALFEGPVIRSGSNSWMILQRGDYILLSQYEDHPYAPRTHQTPTAEIQIGSWQHVIVRYDGDTVKIYINGVLKVDDVAGLFPVTTTNIVVGSSNEFTGAIDDVRIYDWAVPEYWITDLYVPVQ